MPRALLIDLEPGALDAIRGGSNLSHFFRPDNYVAGVNGAGNNWAKGFYTEGAEILEEIQDQIRKEVEACERLQAFQFAHSCGGGTGSGLSSLLSEKLSEEYSDKILYSFSVYPSMAANSTSDVVV